MTTTGRWRRSQEGLQLPDQPNTRARFLLNELLAQYAKPDALHPIAQNSGVDDVFLLPMTMKHDGITGQMAVINLSGSMAQAHPSGIEPETMTLLSMIGTLHANLPDVTEVRFLVDGEPRDTLAGHADLSRTYLAGERAGTFGDRRCAMTSAAGLKIGVFDSGVGGLTVLRALLSEMPEAEYIYLGDTARLPYGSKSQATIARYAVSSARFLLEQGAQFLVIACNTASALALPEIREAANAFNVPVLGVVETGANAAKAHSLSRDVLVMATAATVASHAYSAECAKRGLRALEKACPLLVPLVEEGWVEHAVTSEVVDIYVGELLRAAADAQLMPDTLVLGCTHYPLLREVITRAVPPALKVIDSAEVTARQAAEMIGKLENTHVSEARHEAPGSVATSDVRFYATDSVEKFRALGERFLGRPIDRVELVDLGG